MKVKYVFLITLFTVTLFSCNRHAKTYNFDYGKFENGTYSNNYFNLEFSIPDDWHALTQEQNINLMNKIDEFISEDNKILQQAVETSKITTVILFTGSQYGLDVKEGEYNPNIMLLAENISGTDKVNSSADYLHITRNALQQEPSPKTFPFNSFQIKNINNSEFALMRVVNYNSDNQSFTQDYYVKLEKEFALTFMLTDNSEIHKTTLEQILYTLPISH